MQELSFLFVGPQRTGTTWIYKHLRKHPELCFPKGVKETMFFDRNFDKGTQWYNWHFSECKKVEKRVEVAPTYFDEPKVLRRIKNHSPDTKIIISLRDPVEKARSLYQHHYQKGRVDGSFSEAVKVRPDIITSGYYAEHIERWLQLFNEKQILVISTNEIKNEPDQLLEKLCGFLQIDYNLLNKGVQKEKVNTALQPRLHSVAKMGSAFVSKLHSWRLHWVVNSAKKLGLKSIFFREGSNKLGLSEEERQFLEKEYGPHIQYVNAKFGNINFKCPK
jgi:hypothetical protein